MFNSLVLFFTISLSGFYAQNLMTLWANEISVQDPAFQGEWQIDEAIRLGEPDTKMVGTRRIIYGENCDLVAPDGKVSKGSFKTFGGQAPLKIDLIAAEGPIKGQSLLGIYRIEGERLELAFALPGSARPTEFKSEKGSQVVYIKHTRIQSK